MKKFALIGAGGYASVYVHHFLNLKEAGKIDFCGVVVRHPDRLPETVQKLRDASVNIYPDKESMYRETAPDVVAIPSGIGSHCPLTVEALEHGCSVMVEKPAAGSLAEVDRMMDAEKRTGKFAAVGFQHVHAPDIQKLKRLLTDGAFGRVRRIAAMGRWPRADQYYQRNEWVCKLRGANGEAVYDSPVNNAFAHFLNLSLFLSGKTFETSAHAAVMQAELYRARRKIETFDNCAFRLKTADAAEILCLFTHACSETVNPVLRIECDEAEITWGEKNSWTARRKDGSTAGSGFAPGSGHTEMFQALADRAEGKERFLCPLSVAREHTFVIENLHRFFPVTELAEGDFQFDPASGQYAVNGIAEAFDRGFAEAKLPSELGMSWAKSGRIFLL